MWQVIAFIIGCFGFTSACVDLYYDAKKRKEASVKPINAATNSSIAESVNNKDTELFIKQQNDIFIQSIKTSELDFENIDTKYYFPVNSIEYQEDEEDYIDIKNNNQQIKYKNMNIYGTARSN